MKPDPDPNPSPGPGQMRRLLAVHSALFKAFENQEAERRRQQTQTIVDQMAADSSPQARIAAAQARARATHAKIDAINALADLEAVQDPASAPVPDLDAVRIDDLETLFKFRDRLPGWLRERIKNIHAKVHWITNKGKKGPFNVAVHKNKIPVDKALSILAHLHGVYDGTGRNLDMWIEALIECCLFYKIKKAEIKKGKRKGQKHQFQYARRCQDGEYCNQCNYINISDGLKVLLESYDESAFYRGGNGFAITVAPRDDPAKARAIGRTLTPEDWEFENPDSIIYRESHHGRVFKYGDVFDNNEDHDWHVESCIRRFLGAVQCVFGKLVKNGWLDGIRAKVENSVEFLPFASHQHWHAVGSSTCEHDPQKMAVFIKQEVDKILAETCHGLYADVMVAVIPAPSDLQRWIRYTNKTVDLVGAIASVYNRHSGLRRSDRLFKELYEELCLYPVRSRRVFDMIRLPPPEHDERGAHTYMLYRRYVRGNHKFGKGSILSEPERHREWRKRHTDNEAEFKRRSKIQAFARNLGFRVERCPKRLPDAEGYSTYHIVDVQTEEIVDAGPSGQYGLSLKQCENFLKKKQRAMKSQGDC